MVGAGAGLNGGAMLDLVYCAGGNPRLSQIASEEGWLLGFRSDKTMGNFVATFVDIDYKQPDFERHLAVVAKHRPKYAVVPDLSETGTTRSDIDRAISQAGELAQYCEIPLIVPKLSGQIALLPGAIAIGYSVPSRYGGASYPLWELAGRHVHLLGGSPRKQIQVYLHLAGIATVLSVDGNYAQKQAVRYAEYWNGKAWQHHPDLRTGRDDLYLECFRLSCRTIRACWQQIT